MQITVVNLRTHKKTGDPWEVLIDRRTVLGNPYPLPKYSREESISLYQDRLVEVMSSMNQTPEILVIWNEMNRINALLEGHSKLVLMCWCKPLACHGDVIKKVLEERYQ